MKKWSSILGLALVVSLVFLTSCTSSSENHQVQTTTYRSTYNTGSVPAPEITISMPLGLDAPAYSPSSIADNLFGASEQSYPVSVGGSSGDGKYGTTPVTATVAPTVVSGATQPMIVRTGSLNMVVKDIPTAITQITQLTNDAGGYIVSANKYSSNQVYSGVVSLRIPAESFETIMNSLRGLAVKVTSENVSADDVTQEYTDLSSKLKNLEAAESQLLEIMQRAATVTEVLAVQTQLAKTREDIEITKGRMQYLQQTAAMSLINVNLSQSALVLNLVAGTRNANAGDNVNFGVNIQGGISPYSYEWDFGDGETSTDANPWHRYASSGVYTVSVTVTDDSGTIAADTREDYINVTPGWSAGDVAKGAWRGFLGFLKFLFTVLLWVLYFSPFILIGVGAWWLIRRARRNRRIKREAEAGSQKQN